MKSSVVLIIREPELRNQLAKVLRQNGRDVIAQHHAEGLSALLKSTDVKGFVVGDDLGDADPGFLMRRASGLRPDLLLALVGRAEDDRYYGRLHGETEDCSETDAGDLGRWFADLLDQRAESGTGGAAGEGDAEGRGLPRICAGSPEMQRILQMIDVVAPTESTVLMQGESGTGKDLFARLLHQKSRRADKPLVEVHCGAIPPNLMESELFGHEKGAFTGAHVRKIGLCLSADAGTLFLDEIGELPLDMQVKLLRVLQSGWLRPIGATHSERVDLRVIAATNRDLKEEVLAGRFRLDLFYRLNVISIPIPPLRERPQDIPDLVEFIMADLGEKGIRPVAFTPQVMDALCAHGWPGNVRELENIVERLLLLFPDGDVSLDELRSMLMDARLPRNEVNLLPESGLHSSESSEFEIPYSEDLTLRELEDLHIRRVLRKYEGNKTRAAHALGINVKTLYNKMKSSGLRKEDFMPERA